MATSEENAYIEAFHFIEQRELIDGHSFESFYDANHHNEKYIISYNVKRKHGAIAFVTPMQKWAEGMFLKAIRQPIALGTVDWSRPHSDDLSVESALYYIAKSNEPSYLRLTAKRNEIQSVANLIIKSVHLNVG